MQFNQVNNNAGNVINKPLGDHTDRELVEELIRRMGLKEVDGCFTDHLNPGCFRVVRKGEEFYNAIELDCKGIRHTGLLSAAFFFQDDSVTLMRSTSD